MLRVDRVVVDDVFIVEGITEGTCMYGMGTVAVWNHQQVAEITQVCCYTIRDMMPCGPVNCSWLVHLPGVYTIFLCESTP